MDAGAAKSLKRTCRICADAVDLSADPLSFQRCRCFDTERQMLVWHTACGAADAAKHGTATVRQCAICKDTVRTGEPWQLHRNRCVMCLIWFGMGLALLLGFLGTHYGLQAVCAAYTMARDPAGRPWKYHWAANFERPTHIMAWPLVLAFIGCVLAAVGYGVFKCCCSGCRRGRAAAPRLATRK